MKTAGRADSTVKPKDARLLAEVRRPTGGTLSITREEMAGRLVVGFSHLSESGAPVRGFVLDEREPRFVLAALRSAS